MYFTFLKLYIENFLDFYFELPDFEINDNDFEQKAPKVISYYKKNDEENEFVKVFITI